MRVYVIFSIALIPATKVVPGCGHALAMIWFPEAGHPNGWSCTPEKIIPSMTEMNIVTIPIREWFQVGTCWEDTQGRESSKGTREGDYISMTTRMRYRRSRRLSILRQMRLYKLHDWRVYSILFPQRRYEELEWRRCSRLSRPLSIHRRFSIRRRVSVRYHIHLWHADVYH